MLGHKPGSYSFSIGIAHLKEELSKAIDRAKATPPIHREAFKDTVFKGDQQLQQKVTENILMLLVIEIVKRMVAAQTKDLHEKGQTFNWGDNTDTLYVHDPKEGPSIERERIEMVSIENLGKISTFEPDKVILRNWVVTQPKLRVICLRVDEGSYIHKKYGLIPSHYFVVAGRDDFKLECEYFVRYLQEQDKNCS